MVPFCVYKDIEGEERRVVMKKTYPILAAVAVIVLALLFVVNSHSNHDLALAGTTHHATVNNKKTTKPNSASDDQSAATVTGDNASNQSDSASVAYQPADYNVQSASNGQFQIATGRGSNNPVVNVPGKGGDTQNGQSGQTSGDQTGTSNPSDPGTPAGPTNAAPTVSITSPASGATVSGVVTITATASDDKGIAEADLAFDGQPGGSTTAAAPYSFDWDTTKMANGSHAVQLTVIDTDGTKASSSVTVTVDNVATPPVTPPIQGANLVSNPGVEDSADGVTPTGWTADQWGTAVGTLTYEADAHSGSHSVKATITSYPAGTDTNTGGALNWTFAPVSVTPGKTYKFSNWYKSDVNTEFDVMVNFADGTTQYYYLAAAPASSTWTLGDGVFEVPANAVSATVFQPLTSVGYVQSDDFNFYQYTPTPFAEGLVSLTFDDGWRSIYTNGLPLLQKYNMVSTDYMLTSTLDYPDYMTKAMMQDMLNAGNEIGGHTVDHCDLTGQQTDDKKVCPTPISDTKVNQEIDQNKTDLQNMFSTPVTDFATPYGAYNDQVIADIKAAGYQSHRSTDVGYNSIDNFDPYNIKVQNITSATTPADVQAWVNEAIANKEWLVIVYHEVSDAPEDTTYYVTPDNLDAELAGIQASGIKVVTVAQALNELEPQVAAANAAATTTQDTTTTP